MTKKGPDRVERIHLRLDRDILKRIDKVAGKKGRKKFIKDAVLWKLDQEIPPIVHELAQEVEQLKARVEHLEEIRSTSVFYAGLNDVTTSQVCRDDLDRNILAYLLQYQGASTPELADSLLNDREKRKTIHVRIVKLNERAKDILGKPILSFEKGEVKGKRGAWWLIDPATITGQSWANL